MAKLTRAREARQLSRCPGVMEQGFVDIKKSTLIPLLSQQVYKLGFIFYHFAVRDVEVFFLISFFFICSEFCHTLK